MFPANLPGFIILFGSYCNLIFSISGFFADGKKNISISFLISWAQFCIVIESILNFNLLLTKDLWKQNNYKISFESVKLQSKKSKYIFPKEKSE